jgi:polysaccharide export outer membrane protein
MIESLEILGCLIMPIDRSDVIRGTILAAFVACVVIVNPLSAQEAKKSDPMSYLLGSGDKLRISFFGKHYSDLSGDYEIDGAGIVPLPLVGNIRLGGKTISEAENAIKDAYKPDYVKDPRVSVQVLNYRPFYIWGQVNAPGSYPYVNGITVLEAVVIAGGFTKRAKQGKMKIIRGNDPSRTEHDATPETVILPGDVIEVPQRYF